MGKNNLVLSLFPGIGMLDRAFELADFCVVRGPDLLWGGDIKKFHPPAKCFSGVIGGPPCQAFSPLRHMVVQVYGQDRVAENLIPEFERVVFEAQPDWFVMENSRFAPLANVEGYAVQSFILDNRWLGEKQQRKRRISFGSKCGYRISVDVAILEHPEFEYAVVGDTRSVTVKMGSAGKVKRQWANNKKRTIADMLSLQGFPIDMLDHAPFTSEGKRQAIANGVPLPMGSAIAEAVKRALSQVA